MIKETLQNFAPFWVEGTDSIESYLKVLRPLDEMLVRNGFSSCSAAVGGGVHELDTGYEDFGAEYESFAELCDKLPADFTEAERQKLDGIWLTTLNFERFYIKYGHGKETAEVWAYRGRVEVVFSNENTEKKLTPHIAKLLCGHKA